MASVFFISSTSSGAGDTRSKDPDHVSTDASFTAATVSPQAGDVFELRIGNATTVPTQRQTLAFMELVERWIMQNGLNGLGANLPPLRG
jgi:hypothetical protein